MADHGRRLSETDAANAIYIDFEGLGTGDATPALLGVLVGTQSEDSFRQLILDPRLRAARIARKACDPMSIDQAIGILVDQAEHEHRVIVSWSTHEETVIARVCQPALAARFSAVFRNALDTARPWKRALYGDFAFETDRFGGKHPLKEYFRMVGYDLPRRLVPPAPAKWLAHVLEQMEKNRGQYRSTTTQTKRDWHKLLEYNEHDCRGMRQVCMQAARELALWDAYRKARFVVLDSGREVNIYPEARNTRLDALLTRLGTDRWAIVTAFNPESRVLPALENEARQRDLEDRLRASGYVPLPAEGRDPNGAWSPEPSVFVPGMTRKEARALGREFGQLAVLAGHRGYQARILPSGLAPARNS